METVMGCGFSTETGREKRLLATVERALLPMWRVAPKNAEGRLEWRMVRYLAHRYFMQSSSLLVRGLEPARQVNDSHAGAGEILSSRVPSLVDLLEGKRSSRGFSFEDTVAMVATLEQVIFESESSLLETAYKQQGFPTSAGLSDRELSNVIISYMVYWITSADDARANRLMQKPALLEKNIPHWKSVQQLAVGHVKSMEFARSRSPRPGQGMNTMTFRYSFEDAHEAVASITKSFASFWESECQSIKTSLSAMDKAGTGRVALSDFYAAKAAGDWRFGESEAYLRELGALDESSSRSKQIIIPNYLQGANNCIIANSHYFVCCVNECETVLNEIEEAVGAPVASPEEILLPLSKMSTFDDEPIGLSSTLRAQLDRIAETHGGKVPLHGRLFAQWLHYVMPRECPFPHKSGAHSATAPLEFDGQFVVSRAEIDFHSQQGSGNLSLAHELDEAQWMSQWSEEEELIADYSLQLKAPWEGTRFGSLAGLAVLALVVVGAVGAGHGTKATDYGKGGGNLLFEAHTKAHFV
eukprot:TRINITY_DN1266_c0_g2_i1.p1 TRINITY_DN1266_c0_g2~~TRINITY_DN1266_c0_g2_i1.p1  ORF type:complete len:527 (+),score=114.92 TRINITY_DN1266_c0_g2_i1:220-1800(+)